MKCKNQKETFKFVAERDENAHGYWTCKECGKSLSELRAHNFAHIKPKGMYPELKCDPCNVRILCYTCHSNVDHKLNVSRAEWLDM